MQLTLEYRRAWLWLIPLLLLTTWLGARGLDSDPIWYDEWWSIYNAGGAHYGPLSASGILQRLAEEDPRQTPLFYLLLGAWGSFTGWTPFANRTLPLFLGLFAVAWLYRLGSEMSSPKVGLVAAGVLGTSAFYSTYLHEIRGYTLYVLLTILCLWFYWRIAHQNQKPAFITQTALFLSVAGLLHTLYLAALVVISVGIYHLLFVPKTARWRQVSFLLAAGLFSFLPWLIVGLNGVSRFNDIDRIFALDIGQILSGIAYNFSNGSVALAGVIGAYSLAARGRRVGFILFCAACILALSLLLHLKIPVIIHLRYLLSLLPLIALIVGIGAEQLAKRGLSLVLVLMIWIATGIWNSLPIPYTYPRFDVMVDKLIERGEDGDILVFHGADFPWLQEPSLEYYMHGLGMDYVMMESLPGTEDGDTFERVARDFIGDAPRIWLGINPSWPPNFRWGVFQHLLDENYVSCGAVPGLPDNMNMNFYLYTRIPDQFPLRFGEDIHVSLLESLPTTAQHRLPVLLGWSVDEAVPPLPTRLPCMSKTASSSS